MPILGSDSDTLVVVLDILDRSIKDQTRIVWFQELFSFLKENILEASLVDNELVAIRVGSEATIIRRIADLGVVVGGNVRVFSKFPIEGVYEDISISLLSGTTAWFDHDTNSIRQLA